MTTDTAALLHTLADIIDNIMAVEPQPVRPFMDRINAVLGDPGDTWSDVSTALRAHADSLAPGLPEEWEVLNGVITYPDAKRITAHGPVGACVTLAIRPDGIRWHGHAYAPPAVYAYLLARAQGVGS